MAFVRGIRPSSSAANGRAPVRGRGLTGTGGKTPGKTLPTQFWKAASDVRGRVLMSTGIAGKALPTRCSKAADDAS